MKQWKEAIISLDTPIARALALIDGRGFDTVFVVDGQDKPLGLVTDLDIRQAILGALDFNEPVSRIMHKSGAPERTFGGRSSQAILDAQGKIIGINFPDAENTDVVKNSVVLIAGGLGERLRPLTEHCPKPLLEVKGYPILQKTLESLIRFGFRHFYMTVHYKSQMMRDFFGDGSRWNVQIEYIEEKKRLGTAGGLSMICPRNSLPLVLMNGDVLTTVNFRQLLDFHNWTKAQATVCVQRYDVQIPYGVVEIDGNRLLSHKEKPSQRFLVNAGIYVVDPSMLKLVPNDTFFDMPDLLQKLLDAKHQAAVFPMREDWLDIGHFETYQRAQEII